jgi:flavin reductase
MVCLRSDSRIAKAVQENQNFAVCVLPEGAAETAMRFAGSDDLQVENRFSDVPHKDWDAPHIEDSTSFSCEVSDAIVQGSHTAFFGNVTWAGSSEAAPLIYFDGAFGEFSKGKTNV